ncbi:MaoC family dehydratase [Micromonospora sp. WMMD998]|uniref:MaoC family dehydratase n=1 Tax=Micromonospora sp. WMMD998 TaxID=3016092 RepID=UPI00249B44C6|nr:MaoC family dehydratase [Micromonospora sp. WMMD998]WFE40968.1 MaoC family dehydratase [Micromonospora sp. WMMD998]
MRVFTGIDELRAAVGEHLGHSDWHPVTQRQVDTFAEATGDHQWIHVDAERAAAGPFGATIAHGFLTLSLIPTLVAQVYRVDGMSMGVNYGADRLRFPAPVPVGSRIRAGVTLTGVREARRGFQATSDIQIDLETGGPPACVVAAISLLVP